MPNALRLPTCLGLGLLLIATGTACKSTGTRPPDDGRKRNLTMVMSVPVRVASWDADPGPDGLRLQISFYVPQSSRAVRPDGVLEVRLWPGDLSQTSTAPGKPMHLWQFPPHRLKLYERTTAVGPAYAMKLGWGKDVPPAGKATVVLRFEPQSAEQKAPPPIRRTVRIRRPGPGGAR